MEEHGLQLADAKAEIVRLAKKRIHTIIPMYMAMYIAITEIIIKYAAKYVDMMLGIEITYLKWIRRTADKPVNVTMDLSNRLVATIHSILLYGSVIWVDSLTGTPGGLGTRGACRCEGNTCTLPRYGQG